MNLYHGDSSDDEKCLEEYPDPKIDSKLDITFFLYHMGQKIILSVDTQYKFLKSSKRKGLINDLNIAENIDKNLMSNYLELKQKKSQDYRSDKEMISKTELIKSDLITDFKKQIKEQKIFLKNMFLSFKQRFIEFILENKYGYEFKIMFGLENNLEEKTDFLIYNFTKFEYFENNALNSDKKIFVWNLINQKKFENNYFISKVNFEKSKHLNKSEILSELFISLWKYYSNERNLLEIYKDFYQINLIQEIKLPKYLKTLDLETLKTIKNYFSCEDQDDNYWLNDCILDFINLKNSEINLRLIDERPETLFSQDFASNIVYNRLEHRIIRSILKENGLKQHKSFFTYDKILPIGKTNELLEIYPNGTRNDFKYIENPDSYKNYQKRLSKFDSKQLKKYLKQILQGKTEFSDDENLSNDDKIFLFRFTDLLFNLEVERNVSALLSIPMFFDLLEKEYYNIYDLVEKLPSAIKHAVDISRYFKQKIGYKNLFKFDFKKSSVQYLDFFQFDIRNCLILYDWLELKSLALNDLNEISNKSGLAKICH